MSGEARSFGWRTPGLRGIIAASCSERWSRIATSVVLCVGWLATGHAKAAVAAAVPVVASSQQPILNDDDPRVKASVGRAATLLLRAGPPAGTGELALAVHALAKIRAKFPDLVAENEPVLARMVSELRRRCLPRFEPTRLGGHDNYEAGCVAMALAAVNNPELADELRVVAEYLVAKQSPNGAWGYDGMPTGDTSMTQFALLGLWQASRGGGGPVPGEVWDKAAQWLTSRQGGDGGFAYHPIDPAPGSRQPESTHTMTVGALGSLYLCRDLLFAVKPDDKPRIVVPVGDARVKSVKPKVNVAVIDKSIQAGTAWLEKSLTFDKARGEGDPGGGRWFYYYLYGFERFAALAGIDEFGGTNWYSESATRILARQARDGSWDAGNSAAVDTCFAVLCLVRSTLTSLRDARPRTLGKATLIPLNLSDFLQDASKIRVKPRRDSTGTIIEMLISTEPDLGDEWLSVVDMIYKKPSAFGEQAEFFRLLLATATQQKDTLTMKTALRGLAFTGDYRVVPLLIDAMYYEESQPVQLAARQSLCLTSRKFNGFGYSNNPSLDEWKEEIAKWKAWYRTVRPEAEIDD